MRAYKLFKIKNGKLYPLYIYATEEIPMGVWIDAKVGRLSSDGRHVKSKLGNLALRPGFHSCEWPLADHIGKKVSDGTLVQARDTVWCEVEISDEIDYNPLARKNGINKEGKVNLSKCCLKSVPVGGMYEFRTNPLAKVTWYISGAIMVNRILSNDEVAAICRANGLEPQRLEVAS